MNLDWMDQAECRNHDSELFFPSTTGPASQNQVREAQRICMRCPVIRQCAAYADATGPQFGVFGGEMQRSSSFGTGYRKPRKLTPIQHGTNVGYKKHQERGETPCDRCRFAHAEYERRRRIA